MNRLGIALLGGFKVTSAAGERIILKGRKPQALVAYLALIPKVITVRENFGFVEKGSVV